MGSIGESVNLLEYLRSRSQVDCDSLDVQVAKDLGPFVDCTSNQIDSCLELSLPHREELLKESVVLSRQLLKQYPGVKQEELAFEIAMVKMSMVIAPFITGLILIMSNPLLTSTLEIVKNAERITQLCCHLQPGFKTSRLCIKVASTWEGLQACRKLTAMGIKTLATTLFTMEQSILAAEVGCEYVSPFVHELQTVLDESHDDGGGNLDLCLEIQRYYQRNKFATRVKAAALVNVDEAKRLAGVAAVTVAPDLLRALADTEELASETARISIFEDQNAQTLKTVHERETFVNDERKYREAFARSNGGKGAQRTKEAIDIFREYQIKAEALLRDNDSACD